MIGERLLRGGDIEIGGTIPVAADLAYLRVAIVNVLFYGARDAGDRGWVLVDAGIPGSAERIARAAESRYGSGVRPSAIVLTHGHFDHVGALKELAERWDAPIYAHELELPYLTGRSAYPPPDPTVGGGAMALMSKLYPRGPVDVSDRVRALPADGGIPEMPGWSWMFTPGHTPGHVSLFRTEDRLLIAGDAVVTTKQESAMAVATQRRELHGPPMYYTQDWRAARTSVELLASLEPETLIAGHGRPMRDAAMRERLHELARDFERLAVPRHGRYVHEPAVADERGTVSVPPPVGHSARTVLIGAGLVVAAGIAISAMRSRDGDAHR